MNTKRAAQLDAECRKLCESDFEIMSLSSAAKLLGITQQNISNHITRGNINPVFREGSRVFVLVAQVRRILARDLKMQAHRIGTRRKSKSSK